MRTCFQKLGLFVLLAFGGSCNGAEFSPSKIASNVKTMGTPMHRHTKQMCLNIRGGAADLVSDIVEDAYGWCSNLGNPSALVAGAVIATIYENFSSRALETRPEDSSLTKFKKRLTGSLLLSAFALEVLCIFVTTVTGTMLLSKPLNVMEGIEHVHQGTTPLSFLRNNFEFEYLTARITFLQGLLHWVSGIALGHLIPQQGESAESMRMNRFIGSALFTLVALMVAFYNAHLSFYNNYAGMLLRWFRVCADRYFMHWPPRPMAAVYVPLILTTCYLGYLNFFHEHVDEALASLEAFSYYKDNKEPVPALAGRRVRLGNRAFVFLRSGKPSTGT